MQNRSGAATANRAARLVAGVLLAAAGISPARSAPPPEPDRPVFRPQISEKELRENWGVGPWIWGPVTKDKQTCRLWRAFEIPPGSKVTGGWLRISVDNGYRLMLDGRQIGTGSDWRSVTEYDLGQILRPGRHVVAVEGFNDNREAGMQFGLRVELEDGREIRVLSDTDWRIVPAGVEDWPELREAVPGWAHAVKVSSRLPRSGWWHQRTPTMLVKVAVPPPVEVRFWQTRWFQIGVWVVAAIAVLFSLRLMARVDVQARAQNMLNRERARIARGIHDELGARLTELALQGEVIQTELSHGSRVRPQLEALCEKARDVSSAMDEVVWMINSRRDTLRDFVNFACKHAQRFLESSPIRCRLDVDATLPDVVLELPVRRSLLLAVKEALNNAAKHSGASELFLRIHVRGGSLKVVVEDDGAGFEIESADPLRNGLSNMHEGLKDIGGRCRITSRPGKGCRVEFEVPLPKVSARANGSTKAAEEGELLKR
ncbi:ATP-binding protein [Haloferula sp. A504]|uniref:ATP-binding protein n=1 Tax=Haloferula sp. A504 TaxID=3373601 RepID=UPI0031BF0A46|nr:ATP-binding protein [Verrucomicrobiaceae bacterium E54]